MAHHRERIRCLQELGLKDPASEDDIRKAYKTAAFKYHPDKNLGQDTTKEFQRILTAYKFLTEGDAYLNLMREQANAAEFDILRFLFPWLFRTHNPFYGYYDAMSDDSDDDDDWVPAAAYAAQQRASGASQYYQRSTNFTHTSSQHGQFFQETKTKTKTNKKKKKDAKRAAKLAADREKSEAAQTSSDTKSQNRGDGAKSPTPDVSGKQDTCKEATSQPGKEKDKSQSPESNTEARKDNTEDQTTKKSKKQIQMEQKQRDKEMKELNEELLRQEKERKEKMEKKRAAQEEKERQEREAREQEEQQREEEERQRTEELRILLEKKDEEKKRKKREAMKMKKLLDEFDSCTFLDDNGDFKYTDPEVKNIICRDDINQLGNASKNVQHKKLDTINGLDTESLMKLQEAKQAEMEARSRQEKVLGSPNQEKLGPIGSRPQNENTNHRRHPDQQNNNSQHYNQREHPHQYHRPEQQQRQQHQQYPQTRYPQSHHPRQQHPEQQWQNYNRPPPPRQPTFQAPYWSASQPPPPLHNINTNMPRPSGRFHQGYSNNVRFQNNGTHTRTFTSRGFPGKV